MSEFKDLSEFVGAISSLYTKTIKLYLDEHASRIYSGSRDGTLPIVDGKIRDAWRDLHRRRCVKPARADQSGDRADEETPTIDESVDDQVTSALQHAMAFLRRVLADGELDASEVERKWLTQ